LISYSPNRFWFGQTVHACTRNENVYHNRLCFILQFLCNFEPGIFERILSL